MAIITNPNSGYESPGHRPAAELHPAHESIMSGVRQHLRDAYSYMHICEYLRSQANPLMSAKQVEALIERVDKSLRPVIDYLRDQQLQVGGLYNAQDACSYHIDVLDGERYLTRFNDGIDINDHNLSDRDVVFLGVNQSAEVLRADNYKQIYRLPGVEDYIALYRHLTGDSRIVAVYED